tara:strand:+ start:508 stop:771 length:264 start_codon:yes stop_codon:yes gene_type:complete
MLSPVNKYLLVLPITEEKKESGVLVPDSYVEQQDSFCVAELLAANPESTLEKGERLILPRHMIEKVDVFGEIYHLVLENHVVAKLRN